MPSSWIENVPIIIKCVLAVNPTRIIDLGLGSGKYGFILRELTDFMYNRIYPHTWEMIIDGVEVYGGYIHDHQRSVYNHIFISEAIDFLSQYEGPPYDVAIAIDIIEHFDPWEVVKFVQYALNISRYVIISTPRDFFEQDTAYEELDEALTELLGGELSRIPKYYSEYNTASRNVEKQKNVIETIEKQITAGVSSDADRKSLHDKRDRAEKALVAAHRTLKRTASKLRKADAEEATRTARHKAMT